MSSIILYHVSNDEVRDPDIRRGRKNADFAQGFYLCRDKEFVLRKPAPQKENGGTYANNQH